MGFKLENIKLETEVVEGKEPIQDILKKYHFGDVDIHGGTLPTCACYKFGCDDYDICPNYHDPCPSD